MKYCKKCLQPDTRPGVFFSDSGICGACLYEESKATIDWAEREKELKDICDWARSKKKSTRKGAFLFAIM